MTVCLASVLVAKLDLQCISFFRVAKNDSATALSWQLPVRLQERRTSLARAHSAKALLVYWAPLVGTKNGVSGHVAARLRGFQGRHGDVGGHPFRERPAD